MLCLGGFELYSRWLPLKKRSREEISCPVNRPSRGFAWSLLLVRALNIEYSENLCISKRINVLVSKVSEFMYLEISSRAQTYRKKMLEIQSVTNKRQGATLCHYRTFKSSDFSDPEDLMLIIKETSYNQV